MSYKVEEPNEEPEYYNENHEQIDYRYNLYSKRAKKTYIKVLIQLKSVWNEVYNTIHFMRNNQSFTVEDSNNLMKSIHKIFIHEHKYKYRVYDEYKGYKTVNFNKKLSKLRNKTMKL